MADGYPAVVSLSTIKKGTQFGPFMAQKLFTLKPDILFPLKIFNTDAEDFSEHYFDTSNEDECNWLFFVNPANSEDEQNLICYQVCVITIFYIIVLGSWMDCFDFRITRISITRVLEIFKKEKF